MGSMVKTKVVFNCGQCGAQHPKWQGQCNECGAWNSLAEEIALQDKVAAVGVTGYAGEAAKLIRLGDVAYSEHARYSTGIREFDHVLGGGMVQGSVALVGGDPGIGKSTLLLQVLAYLSAKQEVLYITGEESLQQVALRAHRLGVDADQMHLLAQTHVERIIAHAQQLKPTVMVIDSIQTIFTDRVPSAPGSVSQVRESAAQLVRFAKQTGIALFLVGHVTKEGAIAGPRVLEHMVDSVLYFEGQSDSRFRIVRAIKNRFGSVNELGVFAMTDRGLKEVSNPSAIFLTRYDQPTSGSIVMSTWEGSRPLLVEVQALVDPSHLGNPRRITVGLENNRLAMLLAVLHRHCGVVTFDQDVFVNVVGGLRVLETGADLAVLLSVLSSLKNKPLPADLVVFGEVGLSSEVRPVPSGVERLKEAAKHGFHKAIIPKGNCPKTIPKGMQVIAVEKLAGALACEFVE